MITDFLYHGSSTKNIQEFNPRLDPSRHPEALVYTTPDKALASIFCTSLGGKFSTGRFDDVWHVVISEPRKLFLQNDKGGSIYYFNKDQFVQEAVSDLGETEWISRNTVKPIKEESFSSSLEAMLSQNVQIFFVDIEMRKYFNELPDHGRTILRTLQSENQLRNQNILSF